MFEDVFGSNAEDDTKSSRLRARILSLRNKLRKIGLNDLARPPTTVVPTQLPNHSQRHKVNASFSAFLEEFAQLSADFMDDSLQIEYRSLEMEIDSSKELHQRINDLADFRVTVGACDIAISGLLDHIDSYPDAPPSEFGSPNVVTSTPRELLASRLAQTQITIADMISKCRTVADDPRAIAEKVRVRQTWSELDDMSYDLINGVRSPSSNGLASGRTSAASNISGISSHSAASRKSGYANLSLKVSPRGKFLSPSVPKAKRSTSGGPPSATASRSASRASVTSTQRSVSGPVTPAKPTARSPPSVRTSPSKASNRMSRLLGTTFASRQRTGSLTSGSFPESPTLDQVQARNRSFSSTVDRGTTPTFSETSSMGHSRSTSMSQSRSFMTPSRTSTSSMSNWARAPRQSLGLPRPESPPPKPCPKREYIANPKNKLDVAVGDVVNQMPININVVLVPDTWKDSSGKYWIGDTEPRLCFCRILRSQTVMVRVGGGWTELSKSVLLPAQNPSLLQHFQRTDSYKNIFRTLSAYRKRPLLDPARKVQIGSMLPRSLKTMKSQRYPSYRNHRKPRIINLLSCLHFLYLHRVAIVLDP